MQQLDLTRSAVIMTASKDLSLPGLRAAAIITRNLPLRATSPQTPSTVPPPARRSPAS
ncbi:hypothetical protein [Kitasatospora sp. NPDC058218]|uniref:hypothetical protein n=1 Tax=Kitasatospora sp. NPDC058218 TaxID=3346385 RepID=UPI0036DAF753